MTDANDDASRTIQGPFRAPRTNAGTSASRHDARYAEPHLDDCWALEVLTSAVHTLTAEPGHPAADLLVQDLQTLARTCRRRARAVQALVPHDEAAWCADPLLVRAKLLADKAEDVAVWARKVVLGGDLAVLDRWLTLQRRLVPGIGGGPGGRAPAARFAG